MTSFCRGDIPYFTPPSKFGDKPSKNGIKHKRRGSFKADQENSEGTAVSVDALARWALHLISRTRIDKRDNKLHLNEIPVPEPKPNEILVKVACASLCHSDLMMFEPNDQGLILGQNPVTIGHEASGIVVEAGSGVGDFKPGDKVGFLPAIDCCYECEPCRTRYSFAAVDRYMR
jgi:hypothetical protein